MGAESTVIVGASTKMYLGYGRTLEWIGAIGRAMLARPAREGLTSFVVPSAPMLVDSVRMLDGTGILTGAQTCSAGSGAETGELSATLLAEIGVSLVEVGHAERRARFGETESVVAAKTAAILRAGLTPLLCVGEPERRDASNAAAHCAAQVSSALATEDVGRVIVAYEPTWAIGVDRPASAGYVCDVVNRMRELLPSPLRIVYGGSAGPGMLESLVPSVDGIFLGRFAHDPQAFMAVVDEALDLQSTPDPQRAT